MCNCGDKRESFSAQPFRLAKENISKQESKMWPDVHFTYTGKTALTIRGTISGKNYRFEKSGERLLVDYRDASAFMQVPVLKKI
ncbi:MAG: hypothetical protein JWQ27_1285 [Ferruginibacter sp.]|nr:hypothetical protein [Ferruginibacter sp.]